MEFKALPVGEKGKLADLAEAALRQITERKHDRELKERGINRILRYGIAFSGKSVEVRVESSP